ncbi:hypothetical protein HYU40_03665 [Candidatus Woesearchaeota archaeon]|nr:hypothetical protein [Candidatus Woesearchaeota archaeon]
MTFSTSPALLLFPLLLGMAQFLSDRINIERSRFRQHLASFGAAIAITYLLLVLLPEAYSSGFTVPAYVPLLLGFVAIHLLEKFVYKKFSGRYSLHKLRTYHDELHAAIIFSYHFMLGAILMDLLAGDFRAGVLFVPPLLMFTTIGNWSVHHHYVTQNHPLRLLLASSTLLGSLSTLVFAYPASLQRLFISLVGGILLFIIVRESLPKEKEGKPALFVLGVAAYTLLILMSQ